MTNSEEGFIQALAEDPTDETTALVFADWLDDHGDPRGEFLRVRTALARWEPDWEKRQELERRQLHLLKQHGDEWLGALRPYFKRRHYDRGMAHVTMDARRFTGRRFAADAETGLRQGLIRTIRVENLKGGNWAALDRAVWMRYLVGLDLRNTQLTDDQLSLLLECPYFEKLAWLDLSGNLLTDRSLEVLAAYPEFVRLRRLDLRHNRMRGHGLPSLLAHFPTEGRRHVRLYGNPLHDPTHALEADTSSTFTNSIQMRFALIPAGSFLMGSPPDEYDRHNREGPRHAVTLTKPFWLGVHPVTQREYRLVVGDNPSRFNGESGAGGDYHPADSISFEQATEFCQRLSSRAEEKEAGRVYRLPTEAEWEHAARAGTSLTPFCFGPSVSSRESNFDGSRPYGAASRGPNLRHSTPAGLYHQWNGFGLEDMYGNVWEWCADRFGENYYAQSPRNNPTGPDDGDRHVLRGGSWYFYGMVLRAAFRGNGSRNYSQSFIGFRVACDVKPQ